MSEAEFPTNNNQENLHLHLTEDSIRHVALRFLKTYYKYRPRKGETTAGKNMSTQSGLIVDGYLSFQTDEGKPFLATLEASSYSKRGEVKYTLQKRILFWDALAFGSLIGLLLFSYGYAYDHFTVKQLGLWGSLGILLGTIALVFLIFRAISKGFSRYRYIYAVEQFKRYSADEQWIAIGEDVFSNSNDKRMVELKNQCVYNGFGLVIIDHEFEPHLMITPARKAVVKNRPQIFKRLSNNKIREAIRKSPLEKQWVKLKSAFAGLANKAPVSSGNLLRYQRQFWRQATVVLVSFGLLSFIMYRELKDADILHVDSTIYQDEMAKIAINSRPEPKSYLIDSVDVQRSNYLKEQTKRQPIQSSNTVDFQERKIPKQKVIKTEEVAVYYEGKFIYYDCTRFFGFKGQKFVVTDGLYGNLNNAEKRIQTLSKNGIDAHAFWLGCFDKAKGYVVYYDQIYNEKTVADRAANSFGRLFKKSNIKSGNLEIMVLER